MIGVNLFEVQVEQSDEPTDFDMGAYSNLSAHGSLPPPVPISTQQHTAPADDGEEEPQALIELRPDLADLDGAMRQSLGFGLDALTGVLNVATQWDAHAGAPATLTSLEAVAEACVAMAVGATRKEYAAAAQWLTLGVSDLDGGTIPHWETERRAKRIATSPLVESPSGLWVLPWTTDSTLRIVANYLSDGRLPWPDAALPGGVTKALKQYRQARNRELEKEAVAVLNASGFIVRGNVKPEKAAHYGISDLSGEVDALCIDEGRDRIWVIEAKDPYTPFSARQIRRLVDDFHKPGKYVDRLLDKVRDIEQSAGEVAAALNVPNPKRQWQVIGLMVTRRPEPGAVAVEAKVPFCVIGDLSQAVDRETPPTSGMFTGTAMS